MTVFVVLPAFNEEESLPLLLDRYQQHIPTWHAPAKFIIVDDGSSDNTVSAISRHPLHQQGLVEIISHTTNRGLAAAMRTGITAFLSRSTSPDDIMLTMDSDNTHDPQYALELFRQIHDGASMAICSRFVSGGVEQGLSLFRKILSRGAKLFMTLLAPVPVKDISCGYRAYSRHALDLAARTYGAHLVQSTSASVQAELLIRFLALNLKIVEIPFILQYDLKRGPSKIGFAKTIRGYFSLRGIQQQSLREVRHYRQNGYKNGISGAGGLVQICTYNEKDNIEPLIRAVFHTVPDISILIVDDASPDGTADIVQSLQKEFPTLNLMRRPGKLGLGSAILQGFTWGRDNGFRYVINMDADFSHDPAILPEIIDKSSTADYVVGTRYIKGGATINWPPYRRLLSYCGNAFARLMLSMPLHDLTTAYRLIKTDKLDSLKTSHIPATGYSFVIALSFHATCANLNIAEVPIRFLDRQFGASKMPASYIKEALSIVFKLRKTRKNWNNL